GGVLLSTVLYSLPAWRSLDPLPVLERMDGEDDGESDDDGPDDSLESLVARTNVAEDDDAARRAANAEAAHRAALEQPEAVAT
ncbi:MAG TPA: hypothetical protein VGP15_17355, partial [Burkholderiales bacterium]|nr:hypothetical protein [Burkholderiales bacterium]